LAVPFFRGSQEEDSEQDAELARIRDGGIPSAAAERLNALGQGHGLYTTGLSVNEFALLHRMGPQPLAQVMGASVVRVGWQFLPPLPATVNPVGGVWVNFGRGRATYGPSLSGFQLRNRYGEASPVQITNYKWNVPVVCELTDVGDAWNLARRRALGRLAEEALRVGADAVVGVHLRRGEHDLGKRTIEFVVSGTAIRVPGAFPSTFPVLTDISTQDYWRLLELGHEPTGLLATTVVMFASPPTSVRLRRKRTFARNQELEELTSAFRHAREAVRDRLQGQLSDAHGTLAVGVDLTHAVRRDKFALASSVQTSAFWGWRRGRLGIPYYVRGDSGTKREGWVITMHAAGTAVRRRDQSSGDKPVKTTIRMGGT
jgi:hypothetical protein